ncbi:hypothetical protein ACBI99_35260 [Nonomuraea sp. ATR24]|uniref:hypothetical protein n=1 Tax=Nonomuraea sp. ATR24 TaxID=1676744 RepID=UPI0035C18775
MTSIVAVLGTLLGATLNHLLAARTANRAEHLARADRLRAERMDAYCTLGGALTNYRRGQLDLWYARQESPEQSSWIELRREEQRLRSAALEALYRMELLTDDESLIAKGWEALQAVDRMNELKTGEELDQQRAVSRTLIAAFIRASKPFVALRIDGPKKIEGSKK